MKNYGTIASEKLTIIVPATIQWPISISDELAIRTAFLYTKRQFFGENGMLQFETKHCYLPDRRLQRGRKETLLHLIPRMRDIPLCDML